MPPPSPPPPAALSTLLAPTAAAFAHHSHSSSPLQMTHPPLPLTTPELHSLHGTDVTLVGFGSLLSETSSRTTFPTLTNFRLGRVQGFSARPETHEVSSLSVEPVDDLGVGFVCSLFEVPRFNVQDYLTREEEFAFCLADYSELETGTQGKGLMCLCATDEEVEARWGARYIERTYGKHGVTSIWHGWGDTILPCPVYLRHCVLAAEKQGEIAHASFLRETFLADRRTTVEEHLRKRPDIMATLPPASVANRYTG